MKGYIPHTHTHTHTHTLNINTQCAQKIHYLLQVSTTSLFTRGHFLLPTDSVHTFSGASSLVLDALGCRERERVCENAFFFYDDNFRC